MSATRPQPADLLAHALDYTCEALGHVAVGHLDRPTPCGAWDLRGLLAHMDDALDAFAQAAAGSVTVHDDVPLDVRVGSLRRKAYGLWQEWSGRSGTVRVGGLPVDTVVVTYAATLEVAVHGWDVAQATGARTPLPDDLALALMPAAAGLVSAADRPVRFGRPRPSAPDAGAGEVLLGFLGRADRVGLAA